MHFSIDNGHFYISSCKIHSYAALHVEVLKSMLSSPKLKRLSDRRTARNVDRDQPWIPCVLKCLFDFCFIHSFSATPLVFRIPCGLIQEWRKLSSIWRKKSSRCQGSVKVDLLTLQDPKEVLDGICEKTASFHIFTASSHSFILSVGTSSVQAASRAVPKTPPVPVGEHGAFRDRQISSFLVPTAQEGVIYNQGKKEWFMVYSSMIAS